MLNLHFGHRKITQFGTQMVNVSRFASLKSLWDEVGVNRFVLSDFLVSERPDMVGRSVVGSDLRDFIGPRLYHG